MERDRPLLGEMQVGVNNPVYTVLAIEMILRLQNHSSL